MYNMMIKEYIKRLSLKDINDFALKNNVVLQKDEDKKIYDFINKYYEDVLKGNDTDAIKYLKNNVSKDTYDVMINLYNKYKGIIKRN